MSAQQWLEQIAKYEREFKKWETRAKDIIEVYRDDKYKTRKTAKFNILWSNVQTLVPATFAKLPQPDVSRRFKDQDPVGRVAGMILERALDYEVQHYPDYRATMSQCVHDRFLGGRGTAWARYEPHIEAVKQNLPQDGDQITEDIDEPQEQLDYECAPTDYVHWRDFGHTVARTWEEVTAVWRRVYLTRDACVERFGEEGKTIPLDSKPDDQKKLAEESQDSRALIYEIWDKENKKAYWLSKSLGKIVDEKDDPLGLEGFFPCPKPLFATLTNETLVPIPDYALYQDQAQALDVICDRIDGLVRALQVKGVFNAEFNELGRLFTEGENNTLIPVKNFAAFAEKNGLAGAIDIVDLTPIFNALQAAYAALEEQKQQIYDITGLADIVRGQSAASETATAQQIKGQYASLRLNAMKGDVARFATEILQLKAQIMCAKFNPETLLKVSAADQLSEVDKQRIPQALEMLKANPLRSFRIEVAADTMVQIDEQEEKQARTEMLQAVGSYLKEALPVVQGAPEVAPMVIEMLKFGVTAFKVGKGIEGVIDETLDKIKQSIAAKQGQPPPPDPEMMKVQAQQQIEQGKLQAQQQTDAARLQHEQQLAALQSQQEQQRIQLEQQAKAAEMQFNAQLESQKQQHEATLEQQRMAAEESFNRWKAELEAATKIMVAQISAKASLDQASLNAEQAAAKEMESAAKQDDSGSKMVDMHAQTMEALKGVMETLARPKRIVRDKEGRAEGIE
jgi:hypothetical protein